MEKTVMEVRAQDIELNCGFDYFIINGFHCSSILNCFVLKDL